MPIYTKVAGTVQVAETSSLTELLAKKSFSLVEGTDFTESVTHHMSLADSSSGVTVSLGPLSTCKFLYISSDRAITANLNGSEAVTLGHTAGEEAMLLLPATSLTSLTLDNSSGAAANVYIAMAGS